MSAIVGIFNRNGHSVSKDQIEEMNNTLSHRGPDGSEVWFEDPVGLGHQMLYTTPESLNENLPFEEDDLVITSDARIDNREELSEILGIKDQVEVSDSYFILKSYKKWGEKCPEKLLGDFAFAIWDKNEKKLFCARDHMGIRPFYYFLSEKYFIFSTEINALKNLEEIPNEVNQLRIGDFLISLSLDKEITFYNEIYRLPQGHTLKINQDYCEKKCYWKLDPDKELLLSSDKEYSDKFLEIFRESVRCRMRSDYPIGSLLSGGLDSSSIVCTIGKLIDKENSLKTFSLVFDDLPECDERDFINEVISLSNIEPYLCNADFLSPLSEIEEILELLKEPFNTPNLYLSWEIYKCVKEKNVRVLFDGFDGDSTVFYEDKYIMDLLREKRLKKLFQELKYMSQAYGLMMWQMFMITIVFPLIPELIRKRIQTIVDLLNINYSLIERNTIEVVKKSFIEETDLKNRYKEYYMDPLKKANTNKLRHHFTLNSGVLQHTLEVFDAVGAYYTFQHVYPFFDVRLVEYCLSLPKEQKYSKKWDRIVMRRAMEDILPPEIQWRIDKAGLGLNFRRNMLLYDEEILRKTGEDDVLNEYIDLKNYKNFFKQYQNDFNDVDPLYLWLPSVLNEWLSK